MHAATLYRIALGDDARPDPWQLALATEAWPTVLVAPTGSGKTAAVTLGWAAHRLRSPEATPRRLVWCLPMRTLVEQTAQAVATWFGRLASNADVSGRLPQAEDVHVLIGGVEAERWLDWPERPTVLVGTQDMLLSRALMRGYASSRALWPMEFALLHEDAQWVFDEVQLMGAGRATSAQLEAFRRAETDRARQDDRTVGTPSRSLWISATLDPRWLATVDYPAPPNGTVVRVDPNAAPDGRLAQLARARKRLTRLPAAPVSTKKTDVADYVGRLADAIVNAHQDGRLTLAIVNRVDRAQTLRDQIQKRLSRRMPAAPTLALVHSRFCAADRAREMEKARGTAEANPHGRIVVATQAVEAGVDISAAVLFTELAPWSSLVQRFGRANRYAELPDAEFPDGADVRWIDLLPTAAEGAAADKDAEELARPYEAAELRAARERLAALTDVAPVHLPAPDDVEPPRRVIRRKDLDDLFDTDPDLTGFDVDISPYVRDADDTDIRVFWRQPLEAVSDPPRPGRDELCAVSIGSAGTWIKSMEKLPNKGRNLLFQRDPQWRRRDGQAGAAPAGWMPLEGRPWPGLVLLAYPAAGGYREDSGFTGNPKDVPEPIPDPAASPDAGAAADGSAAPALQKARVEAIEHQPRKQGDGSPAPAQEAEGHDEDPLSGIDRVVPLADHLRHVAAEAESLCVALGEDPAARAAVVRAAHWHDLGKAHEVFQDTMRRGLGGRAVEPGVLLAKTSGRPRHGRSYFRHELASALAFLAHEGWSRDANLVAYLIAAHHGKVRLNLRALPREAAPQDGRAGARFARGVWEGDTLPPFALQGGERWEGGELLLSIMELGWDDVSRESWTERTRELLARFGPFRLAWLETLVRLADWRASAKERAGGRKDGPTDTSGPARPAGSVTERIGGRDDG
ncbi:MAG: CRISPR-associated endonuclease Cas3'' [Acidobacteria bacterium]|nr:CRISPR-associated endonuclease Cas3'' [Acidobacteriota bacterium]